MDEIKFNIKSWHALSAALENQQQWLQWSLNHQQWPANLQSAAVNLIAPMMRRRMSHLSKLAVQSALQLSQNQPIDYIIFSSRHGELTRTVSLLEDIIKGDAASPTAFSQSVHNTAAGLFTIASKRATPVTSLAAGSDSLPCAIIEAYCYLAENPKGQVLIVDFDEPLLPLYRQYENQHYQGYALAILVETGEQFSIKNVHQKTEAPLQLPHALHAINFLVRDQREMHLQGNNKQWIWTKNNDLCTAT